MQRAGQQRIGAVIGQVQPAGITAADSMPGFGRAAVCSCSKATATCWAHIGTVIKHKVASGSVPDRPPCVPVVGWV